MSGACELYSLGHFLPRKMADGLMSSSCPMLTLFLSPPLTPLLKPPPTIVSLHLPRPRVLMTEWTRSSFSAADMVLGSRSIAAKNRVSKTVKVSYKRSSACKGTWVSKEGGKGL